MVVSHGACKIVSHRIQSKMIETKQTPTFKSWFSKLRDDRAKRAIINRIGRIGYGLFGDSKPVGEGVSELRIDVGPGYRV
jgi:putative addiction module killer protein